MLKKRFLVKLFPRELSYSSIQTFKDYYLSSGEEEIILRASQEKESELFSLLVNCPTFDQIVTPVSKKSWEQMISRLSCKPLHSTQKKGIYQDIPFLAESYQHSLLTHYAWIEFSFSDTEQWASFVKPHWLWDDITADTHLLHKNL